MQPQNQSFEETPNRVRAKLSRLISRRTCMKPLLTNNQTHNGLDDNGPIAGVLPVAIVVHAACRSTIVAAALGGMAIEVRPQSRCFHGPDGSSLGTLPFVAIYLQTVVLWIVATIVKLFLHLGIPPLALGRMCAPGRVDRFTIWSKVLQSCSCHNCNCN